MGFRPEPTIFTLTFKGTFLEGLVVKIGCCTVREFNDMMNVGEDTSREEAEKNNQKIIDKFLEKLVSWNLENADGSGPTPQTVDGLNSHENRLIRSIIAAWQVAQVDVPAPLRTISSNGSNLEEQSLDLGKLSESLGSLPKQN
jgi:hypothetical protein